MAVVRRPSKIGKYDVVEVLGEGGMGAVYKAVDPRIGRTVAIKVIKGDFADDPELLRRFDIEARAVGNLQHPNIVTVYDFGEENGSPYLVMQYLDGTPLDKVVAQRQPLEVIQKLDIIIGVLKALDYAHEHGVIHRDVKPANVHLLKDGSVKLLDFGIAREGNLGQTKTGQVMGTMYYMPPEQMNGEVVDRRGDVFSTGIILFELLTYSLPFDARDQTSIIVQRLKGDPPPPLSKYFDNYPLEIDDIIARAMMRDRDERYSRAEEFAFDLTRVQERLKRDKASHYVDQARALIAKSDLLKARDLLSEVIRIDTQNSTAKQLHYEVQQLLQAQQRVERVQRLRAQAEDALAAKQLANAADLVEQAIKIDKNDLDLLELREKIQEAKARAEQVLAFLKRASAAQQLEQFEVAHKAVADALALDPSDTDAKVMQAAIARQLVEQEKRNRVQQLLQVARREISARQYEAAGENISKAKTIDPAHPEIPGLEKMLAAGQEQGRRHVELQQLCAEIEQRLVDNNLAAARDLAGNSLRKFPGEERLIRLKIAADEAHEQEERRLYIEQQILSASRLVGDGQASSALKLLQDAERLYPRNTRLFEYIKVVREAAARESVEHEKKGILIRAGAAIRRKSFAEAIEILERGLHQFPDDAEIGQLLGSARQELERETRKKQVEEVSRKARQYLETKAHTDAISLLEQSVAEVSDPDLMRLLEYARKQAADYNAGMQHASQLATQMLEDGRPSEALKFLETQVGTYGRNAEFQALLSRVRTQVKDAQQARDRLLREVEHARSLLRSRDLPEAETIVRRCQLEAPSEPEVKALVIEIDEERKALERRQREQAERQAREMQQRAAEAKPAAAVEHDARTKIFIRSKESQVPATREPAEPIASPSPTGIDLGSQGRAPTEWLSVAGPQPIPDEHVLADVGAPFEHLEPVAPPAELELSREVQPLHEPRKSKQTVLIAVVAVLLLIGGVAVWFVSQGSKHTEAYVSISGAPAGALYRVGDKTGAIASDGTATVLVRPGSATVELDAIGYEHYSKDGIDVKAGETARVSVLMTKTLPPLKPVEMGTLVIKSKSEFADVWVNGKYQDRTAKDGKYTIQLPPDKYEIQLKKNGFEDSPIQRMEIAAGTTSDLTFPPLKKSENAQRTPSEASIIIKSEPGARVRVNDEDVGTIEPNGQLGRKIQAGPYHVEVSMLGRTTFEKKDKTVADQRVIIVAKLPPLPPPPTQPPTPTTAVTPVPSTTPAVSTPVSAPSVNLSADKTSVEEGQSVVVTWETANAQEAFLNGKPADLFGRQSFNPTQGSDYVLLAKGKGGDYSKSVHVDVRKAQPPPSAVSDTDAIRRAIQQYRAALESENTVQLELIWPRIDPGSKKNWESYFHDAKSLRAEVKCLDDPIVKAPDKAELGCTQALTGTMKSGQVVSTKPKPVTFVLSKKEGSWLIDTVK